MKRLPRTTHLERQNKSMNSNQRNQRDNLTEVPLFVSENIVNPRKFATNNTFHFPKHGSPWGLGFLGEDSCHV